MCKPLLSIVLLGAFALAGLGAEPKLKQEWRNPKDGMRFVWIPPGSFPVKMPRTLGTESATLQVIPIRTGFWLGRTEVTVGQFRQFVKATGYITEAEKVGNKWNWQAPGFKQSNNHPVVYLNEKDAAHYAVWAGVDLPTEAEWLYACRAGTTNRFYWGDQLDDRYVWHRENTHGLSSRRVATKRPNPWGLYDMIGNAREYCRVGEDCFRALGSSWVRCPSYRHRSGFWIARGDLIAEEVEPQLHECDPNPKYPPYPWDDDRGFRCIHRTHPQLIQQVGPGVNLVSGNRDPKERK